ncbi:MAG: tetratricopeptide repeat protein [Porticoccus sp.]|nr:tetratricopeptide repeat protein [Porticoccus sp.]
MTNIDLLEAGLKCYQLGNLDAAEKHFRQVVSRDSSNVHGLNLLGMVCVNTGRHEEAVQLITQALKIKPVDPQAHGNMGLAYQRMENLELAEQHFRKSIEINPNNPAIWNSLGNVLREKGQASDAVKIYESILKVNGNYPACWTNLSQALVDLGKLDQAFQAVRRALQIDPTLAESHNQLAEVYRKTFKFDLAISAFKKSLELDPTLYESMLGLATTYRESEDPEAALTVLTRLVKLQPGHAKAYTVLGILKEQLGDSAAAAECFKKSIALAPDAISPHSHLSQIKGRKSSEDEILAMERLQQMTNLSREDMGHLQFGLGEAYDQQGQTDKAFKAWLTANQLKAERHPYDPEKRKQHRDLAIEHSQILATKLTETPSQEARQLVFVIGMPRSGTSLTDQILSSNTNVSSLGEVGYADEMAKQVKKLTGKLYPQGLSGLTDKDINLLREDFLKKIPLKHSDYQVLIDKTPMNFQFLGLLAEVFPSAKFIHCRRNPMDNCFSIFKLSFANHQEYAHELTALGRHYMLYEGMMEKWKEMYPHRILDVYYEDTVTDIEAQCVRMVDFLGLGFEQKMLEFYSSERLVRTPSASQVRQPIYKSSVQAWKKYDQHLQPLVSALGAEKQRS